MKEVDILGFSLLNSSLGGDMEGVMAALAQGGSVTWRNRQGFSPFLAAAQSGHTDICGLLLAHGSNVNEAVSITMGTALFDAAARGDEPLVRALLSWGATVDLQDHAGFTPLHAACQDGHLGCVFILLKAGASVSLPHQGGMLPIHLAADRNQGSTHKDCNVLIRALPKLPLPPIWASWSFFLASKMMF